MRFTRWGMRGLAGLSLLILVAAFVPMPGQAQVSVLNYFAQTASNDNVLNIDGTLEFEDKATVIDHGVGSVPASGYLSVTTNLSGGITTCTLTLKSAAGGTAPGLDPYSVTGVTTTGSAVLDIHVWKATSSSNPTLIRSTTAASVGYTCEGAD